MTREEARKTLTAKVECMKRESSGIDQDCNYRNCDECKLCYEQGTVGEQIEALQVAISALGAINQYRWERDIAIQQLQNLVRSRGKLTMREILFRGKTGCDGDWVYGGIAWNMSRKKFFIHTGWEEAKVIPETVGQYTGLNDKNKTGIFENDILSAHPDELFPNDEIRLIVVWHDYGWFGKDSKGGFISLDGKWVNELFEVIGNIYDNPELLGGESNG